MLVLGRAASRRALPLVGTFHAYSTNRLTNNIASADRARGGCSTTCTCASPSPRRPRWTAQRFFGGRYRIVPNGVGRAGAGAPAPREPAGEPAADRVRRPGRRAQGPAGAAARVRGAARARPGRADGRRRRPRRGRAAAARRPRRDRRSAASTTPRSSACSSGRRAVRAVARRRELRHGADGGVRGGHAGRRLRHRRLPRRRARRRRRPARAARRRDRARRDAARPRRSTPERRARWARPPREHAERFAWPHVAARGARAPTRTRSRRPRRRRAAQRAAVRDRLRARRPAAARARRSACRRSSRRARRQRARRARAGRAPRRAARRSPRSALVLTVLALQRIGVDEIVHALLDSSPPWVLVGARR